MASRIPYRQWPTWSTIGRALALLLLFCIEGCAPRATPIEQADSQRRRDTPIPENIEFAFAPESMIIGRSVEGRPIECRVLGRGPDISLFIGTIHGNESSGTPLLGRLGDYLAERPELLYGRQVILLPLINPDGMARHSRYNARGVDLNRNFPVDNWKPDKHSGAYPLSEPEAQVIYDVLGDYRPHRVIAIHEPLFCIDYDGPGEALAMAMAACSDLPVRRLGGLPGSLGSYVGRILGRPIITVEFRRFAHRRPADELWEHYHEMLLAAVMFPDSLPTHKGIRPSPEQVAPWASVPHTNDRQDKPKAGS